MTLFKEILKSFEEHDKIEESRKAYCLEQDKLWQAIRREESLVNNAGFTYVEFDKELALEHWREENPDYIPEEEPDIDFFVRTGQRYGLQPSFCKPGYFLRPPSKHLTWP